MAAWVRRNLRYAIDLLGCPNVLAIAFSTNTWSASGKIALRSRPVRAQAVSQRRR
jgi:hypothetical protein